MYQLWYVDHLIFKKISAMIILFVSETDFGLVFLPEDPKRGLIFYPGGKVEETAYAPLMREAAENGTLCVLLKMPLRLAVLDVNAADGIQTAYPVVKNWYISGHSLGGSMAASYAAKHTETFQGLILLAAYSTEDLRTADFRSCRYTAQRMAFLTGKSMMRIAKIFPKTRWRLSLTAAIMPALAVMERRTATAMPKLHRKCSGS